MSNQLTSPIWIFVYALIAIATVASAWPATQCQPDRLTISDIIQINA